MTAPGALTRLQIAKVAAHAQVDPRTVTRALEGRTKSESVRSAIGKALRAFGFVQWARKVEGKK